ncbi:XRE family transcriptional regulator [Leptospira noumeaensis]|uniref:XRE family transcriptional regulator n=1 Tax=Leptospira noumeaensis TaxID=2484964 RepID=A0A4R9IFQ4_9LEPT|nr:helix-turn-helix transcriptional regulator [Leptospira noumeaensis]TGK87140.1 XRE family transcriptional regulator [Leptospira noumeaensis]
MSEFIFEKLTFYIGSGLDEINDSHDNGFQMKNGFGDQLREWRKLRKKSQLELALDAEISSKHISFLETGRANPSKEMIHRLSDVLDIPFRERNLLMLGAGLSPSYSDQKIDDPSMKSVSDAIHFILKQQEPYPAILINSSWKVLRMNHSAGLLFSHLFPGSFTIGQNLMELIFHPDGFRKYLINWEEVSAYLLGRLRQEARLGKKENFELYQKITSFLPQDQIEFVPKENLPLISIDVSFEGKVLSFLSVISSFGTPLDVGLQELKIETFFPNNKETAETMSHLASAIGN